MRDRVRGAVRAACLFFQSLLIAPRNSLKLFTGPALIFLIVGGLKRYPSAETEPAETKPTETILLALRFNFLALRFNFPLHTFYVLRYCCAALVQGVSEISECLIVFALFFVGRAPRAVVRGRAGPQSNRFGIVGNCLIVLALFFVAQRSVIKRAITVRV